MSKEKKQSKSTGNQANEKFIQAIKNNFKQVWPMYPLKEGYISKFITSINDMPKSGVVCKPLSVSDKKLLKGFIGQKNVTALNLNARMIEENLIQTGQTDLQWPEIIALVKRYNKSDGTGTKAANRGKIKELEWQEDHPEFISNSDAIRLSNEKMTLPKLGKLLRPDGFIRYMRKGRRCKVHIQDFKTYIEILSDRTFKEEDVTDEMIESFLEKVEQQKISIRNQK